MNSSFACECMTVHEQVMDTGRKRILVVPISELVKRFSGQLYDKVKMRIFLLDSFVIFVEV